MTVTLRGSRRPGGGAPPATRLSLSFADSTCLPVYDQIMSLSNPRYRPELGLYSISVVTELTGIGAYTLRGDERAGFVAPARTEGGTRRHSDNDVARLRRVLTLVGEGVNLMGVGRILQSGAGLATLRSQVAASSRASAPGRTSRTSR